METILLEFVNTLDRSLKRLQAEVGGGPGFLRLTLSQFQYIDAIHSLGAPTVSDVAARLNIRKASATAGIHKLEQMGYVTKTQSSQDKRVFHVALSAEGERLVAARVQALREYGAFIRAALTEEEARQFESILAKLVQLFEQGG